MRAIIVGAGIGGVTTAIALRRAGIDVVVYERAPEAREVGAGIGPWSNAIGALRMVGLDGTVLARGECMRVAAFLLSSGRVLVRSEAAEFERAGGTPIALVHRAELLEELLRAVPAEAVRFGHTLLEFAGASAGMRGAPYAGGRVRARFETGDGGGLEDEGDLLIGADGINSAVRAQMLGAGPARYAGYPAWRGVVAFPEGPGGVEPGYVAEVWGRGARFGITRIGGGRVYWWATVNAPASPREQGELDEGAKAALLASHGSFCEPVPSLLRATDPARIHRNDIVDRPPTRRWNRGRVLLIGDAAHPTTPNLGMGGCMAIEDGVILGEMLRGASEREIEGVLAAFVVRRYRKTSGVVTASRLFGAVGQWENAALCALRNGVMRVVAKPAFRRAARRMGRFDG